jgi:hypothetical protein
LYSTKRARISYDGSCSPKQKSQSSISTGAPAVSSPTVVITSSSSETEDSPAAHNAVTIDIKDVLLSLGSSNTQLQATQANIRLRRWIQGQEQQAFDAEAVTVIAYSILRFKICKRFVTKSLGLLLHLAKVVSFDKVGRILLRLDFLDHIPLMVNCQNSQRSDDFIPAQLLTRLAMTKDFDLKLKLGSDAIIKFILSVMTSYPDDTVMNALACEYFAAVSLVPEVKERLREQGVVVRLAVALQRYSSWDRDDEDFNEENRRINSGIIANCKMTWDRIVN